MIASWRCQRRWGSLYLRCGEPVGQSCVVAEGETGCCRYGRQDSYHPVAGGSGLVGDAAIKFAIAAGHFVIALVRRGGSLSVGGLASEETLKIIEVDFDALDQYQPAISALAPNALICALGTTIRSESLRGTARSDRSLSIKA